MDNENEIAMSEATPQEDPHFATEVEDTPAPAAPETESEGEAPEKAKLPRPPKSTREALEQAFDKAKAPPLDQLAAKPMEPAPPPLDLKDGPRQLRAPGGWKPEAREAFDALPEIVKQEVARREYETAATLEKTATERRVAYDFLNAAAPYESHYRAMGIDSIKAAQMLFQAEHTMRVGNVAQKAAVVGKLIDDYGIDLDALNDHLNKRQPQVPATNQPLDAAAVQRMVEQQVQQHQQRSALQSQQTQINTTIEQFANDPKNEFFNDVAPAMIGLLQSGVAQDLQMAYEQACYANPSVRNVLMQRNQAGQQADKARLAAASASLPAKGPRNPSQPATQRFKSTRDALEAAFAAHEKNGRV